MRLLISGLLLGLAVGCADGQRGQTNGLVLTHDGRWTTETAEVAQSEFAFQLGQKAQKAAGPGYHASVKIRELPELNAVKADEFGWKKLTLDLTLAAPPASTAQPAARANAEAELRAIARYRVANSADITIHTSEMASAADLPGAQKYTTVADDTFAAISAAFYGTSQHWRTIADANPGIDAAGLPAGTMLIIPAKP